ncbi:MAG: alpha/beta hydrolase [Oscillospiraceae bacterium]|nr:alpha/beta hydrolase [Oscillospiraceae bacterium]
MCSFTEFTLPSSDGVHTLHVCAWRPEGTPKGVVQISHGIAEHILRYDRYARVLADHGYFVVGNDHLGHGTTADGPRELGYPGEDGGWLHMADDLHRVCQHTRGEYPTLPYVLLGHSMGSFLARTFLIRYPGQVDGCILSGTGQEAAATVRLGGALANAIKRARGGSSRLDIIQKLCFGSFNKKIQSPRTP